MNEKKEFWNGRVRFTFRPLNDRTNTKWFEYWLDGSPFYLGRKSYKTFLALCREQDDPGVLHETLKQGKRGGSLTSRSVGLLSECLPPDFTIENVENRAYKQGKYLIHLKKKGE